eukprot:1423338-Pyramimonas_sp.AAC.1
MPTSLAPSPMASVFTPRCLTSATTSAFCSGDMRQHTTALLRMAMVTNDSASPWLITIDSACPSITIASLPGFGVCATNNVTSEVGQYVVGWKKKTA